eukprot:TRINITY_DN2080_c0_g2_i2.p1 TRINITY_DN2080_c0_g2~~TRINITY_DN2080_c0_g2_i2.p1  ORF type:complete len:364 (-),score=40.40 TRINITY_DN2080_c0_g2_i2:29-1069(-)
MFRIELVVFAQLIGALLLYTQYEINAVSNKNHIQNLKNFIAFNNSPSGVSYTYFPLLVGVGIIISVWQFLFRSTIVDLFIQTFICATAYWVWIEVIPTEKNFLVSDSNLTRLIMNHHALAAILISIVVFIVLASRIDYRKDPVELIPLHVLAGLLVLDVSFDVPLLFKDYFPLSPDHLKLHLAHVTSGVGGVIIEIVVPSIIGVIGLIILYRIYQRWRADRWLLVLFGGTGALFALFVTPLEVTLSKTKTTNISDQLLLCYAHLAFLGLIFFVTFIKLYQTYTPTTTKTTTKHVDITSTSADIQKAKNTGKTINTPVKKNEKTDKLPKTPQQKSKTTPPSTTKNKK